MINQDQLKQLFDYREDGNLVRKVATKGQANFVGSIVGCKPKSISRNNRYTTTKIKGQHYSVHKLIYLWHTGVWAEQLDHINKDSLDNRIENLRQATSAQNASNRKIFTSNTSGVKGVSWHKVQKKWFVYVDVNKKRKNVGYFSDFELADLVAIEARDKYHGVYANHF